MNAKLFFEQTVPIWNALPDDTVTAQSLTMFKHKLKGAPLAVESHGAWGVEACNAFSFLLGEKA